MELTQFSYLAFHVLVLGSIGISKIFYPKIKFPSLAKLFWVSLLGSLPLLLLDLLVTDFFWFFEPTRVLPLPRILTIPFEELLFFITVPTGLLVLQANFPPYFSQTKLPFNKLVFLGVLLALVLGAILAAIFGWWYTVTMFGLLALTLLIVKRYLCFNRELLTLLLVAQILTLIFNMYLTALPVVFYNNQLKSNLQIGTIPIEDFLFGLILTFHIYLVYYWYEKRK